MKLKLVEKLKTQKLAALLLCAASLGILLIFLSPSKSEKISVPEQNSEHKEYCVYLEEQLEKTIEKIEGVSSVKVMVTLKESFEKVYINDEELQKQEQEERKTISSKKELVLKNDGSSKESPVLLKQIYPEILGVAVICKGGNVPETEEKIISLCKTVLSLPSNRIFVTGGK